MAQFHGLPSFSIIINGVAISGTIEVLGITIVQAAEEADFAIVEIRDIVSSDLVENFKVSNDSTFEVGNDIQLKLGYDQQNKKVFNGVINRHELSVSSDNFVVRLYCISQNHDGSEKIRDAKNIKPQNPEPSLVFGESIIAMELTQHNDDNKLITGTLLTEGSLEFQVYGMVDIECINQRFDGEHLIIGLTHILKDGTWQTEVAI